ncbi:MAG: CvpA family protein [Desulfotomaculaceae bacterium]
MNWLDWLLIAIIVLSAWHGFKAGFIVGVARLLGLVLGLAAAFTGYKNLAVYLDRQWNWGESISVFILERFPQALMDGALDSSAPENMNGLISGSEQLLQDQVTNYATIAAREMAGSVLELLSFVILALAVYILVNIMMRALSGAAAHTILGPLDRIGGLILGLARGGLVIIIAAALLNPMYSAGAVTGDVQTGFLSHAVIGSVVLPYAQTAVEFLKLQFPGWPLLAKPARFI